MRDGPAYATHFFMGGKAVDQSNPLCASLILLGLPVVVRDVKVVRATMQALCCLLFGAQGRAEQRVGCVPY